MAFSVAFPTRHTDTFAGTAFVHAGVILGLTELAYAAFEQHCGINKSANLIAVQRETRAVYHAPLRWEEGASIEVTTTNASERGFSQEFSVRSSSLARRSRRSFTTGHGWTSTLGARFR